MTVSQSLSDLSCAFPASYSALPTFSGLRQFVHAHAGALKIAFGMAAIVGTQAISPLRVRSKTTSHDIDDGVGSAPPAKGEHSQRR
jgi:hypothetical protein